MGTVSVFYEFRCDRCQAVRTIPLPMTEAPALGATRGRCACGGKLVRILSASAAGATAKLKADRKYPYTEVKFGPLAGARQNALGQSVIESRRHEIEVCARNGLKRV